MRDYGKVMTTFWTSDDTNGMSDTGKLLALYLLTGPHTNLIGCFRLTDGYVSDDLRWPIETVSKGFAELKERGFATRDEDTKWVFIHSYLKWNEIENPNQGKSAARLFEQIPGKALVKALLVKALRRYAPRFPEDVLIEFETVSKGFMKPFLNQEQEQEQDQKQEQEQEQDSSVPNGTGAVAPPDGLSAQDAIFQIGVPWFVDRGGKESNVRSLLGGAVKHLGADEAWSLVKECMEAKPIEAIAWMAGAINQRIPTARKPKSPQSFDKVDYSKGVSADGSF